MLLIPIYKGKKWFIRLGFGWFGFEIFNGWGCSKRIIYFDLGLVCLDILEF